MQMRDATRVVQKVIKKVIGCAAVCAAALAPAVETCWYASPDGSPEADCLTWETAGTLSNAVARMSAGGSGTADSRKWVVLKSGTVEETAVYDLAQETGTCCTLAAAYLGIRSESGDPRTTVLKGAGTNVALRCVLLKGYGTRLDGLTFRDFANLNASDEASYGGAVRVDGASAQVASCVFTNNAGHRGSAVYVIGKDALVTNCTFVANRGLSGNQAWGTGGIAFMSSEASPLVDSTFSLNCGFYAVVGGRVWNSHFVGNLGGVSCHSGLVDCEIVSNRVSDRVSVSWGSHCYAGSLRQCRVFGNFAPEVNGSWDNVSFSYQTSFTDCQVVSNAATLGSLIREANSTRCVYVGNTGGKPVLYGVTSVDDRFEGNLAGTVRGGKTTRGVFIGNRAVIFESDADGFLFASHCLVVSNTCTSIVSGNDLRKASFRACTIVDNDCSPYAIPAGFCAAHPCGEISSSLVVGNGTDFEAPRSPAVPIAMSNTVYGVGGDASRIARVDCQAAAREQLRFAAPDAAHPWGYCPSRLCPGVDGGLNLGYDETSTDLAGRRRVIGAAPDAGCYEYEPEPQVGMIILIR